MAMEDAYFLAACLHISGQKGRDFSYESAYPLEVCDRQRVLDSPQVLIRRYEKKADVY